MEPRQFTDWLGGQYDELAFPVGGVAANGIRKGSGCRRQESTTRGRAIDILPCLSWDPALAPSPYCYASVVRLEVVGGNQLPIYLSLDQAASVISLSVKTIRRRIADGTIPAYQCSKKPIPIRLDELEAAMRPIRSAK